MYIQEFRIFWNNNFSLLLFTIYNKLSNTWFQTIEITYIFEMSNPVLPRGKSQNVQGWELELIRLIVFGIEWAVRVSRVCKVSRDDSL